MQMTTLQKLANEVVTYSPVMPVLVLEEIEAALHVAQSLIAGGLTTLEVTLRSEKALAIIAALAESFPEAKIGAGTVCNPDALFAAERAGAQFAISPGHTPELLGAGKKAKIPFIPGVSSASDILICQEQGYQVLKFFPAEASGGVKTLKAMAGPFPNILFCPTGGIRLTTAPQYLALANVPCLGGSWLASKALIEGKHWDQIQENASQVLTLVK